MLSIDQTVFKTEVAAFIAVFFVVMFFGHAAEAHAAETGIISAGQLHVRLKPEKESPSAGILSKGTTVRIITHLESGWIKIERGPLTGYIRNRPKYVRLYKEKTKKVRKKEGAEKKGAVSAETRVKKQKDDIGKIAREIETRRSEATRYEKKEREIINDLHQIDRTMNQAKGEVSRLKTEIRTLDLQISSNRDEIQTIKKKSLREEQFITKRLVALYKMGRLAPTSGFASADNIYELISRKMALGRILDADVEIMDNYMAHMDRLNLLKNGLEARKRERLTFQDEVGTNLAVIRNRKAMRSELLSHVKNQKSLTIAAIQSLEEAARKLKQTLITADKGIRSSRGATDSGPSAFKNTRGHLLLPVEGKIVSRFGKATDEKLNIMTFQNGINIEADKGEPVRAVESGTVLFADWLKGYGNLIIINHGNSYYTLYAHADELFKAKGDMVENREVIATVGDTGLLGNPGLHFEIRHRGTPVDPIKWLATK